MKTILFILSMLAIQIPALAAQETEVTSDISEVTVYLSGAQVTRTKTLDIPAGRSLVKFINLSPFIDSKSISVFTKGDLTLLSVNLQHNFLALQTPSKKTEELTKTKQEIEQKIRTERAYLEVLDEELNFLKVNSSIGGANTGTSLTALKEANLWFSEKIATVKLKQIERQSTLEKLHEELQKIENQLSSPENQREFPTGEILATVEAKNPVKATFEIKYIVSNAGWTPSYDIKIKNIEMPAELVYKANIHQSTQEEWKNVRLRLSSSDPNTSSSYREPDPYFLNYNLAPPSYGDRISRVAGRVLDSKTSEPLPGASVLVKGSTIGTVTDVNGAYSLSIPSGGNTLVISYIGYRQTEAPVNSAQMDFWLEADERGLEEVVVVGYGTRNLTGRLAGFTSRDMKAEVASEDFAPSVNLLQTEQLSRQTSVEFEIQTPYTVLSDGKNLTINIDSYLLPAGYQYFSAPKVDKNAYLTAHIVDWEQYNLLDGEASVFFEDTYTGKTLLDTRDMSDTLRISLGVDHGISIERKLQKQFSTRQFLGSKKEESRNWQIVIKNNKTQKIRISVFDQVPVSTLEEIEVKADNISNGQLEPETGIIKWDFELDPSARKELELKYTVTYPKNRKLLIE
jgi:hypothetical protein